MSAIGPASERLLPPAPGEASVVIQNGGNAGIGLAELWQYRELIGFMALRDLKVRYKQSMLGVSWAVLQPLGTMVVFTALFGVLFGSDRIPTIEGVPYALSTFCALVPWQLFARSLTASGDSLVANQQIITKVYFPRLVVPLAPILAALVDFVLAFAVLLLMMAAYGISPGPALVTLPLFILFTVLASLSVSLWLCALNALYRDVRHTLPFLTQVWMFATPVVYTAASVLEGQPNWVQVLYGMNPMVGVVEAFRWALLGGPHPQWIVVATSGFVTIALLAGGLVFFRRLEPRFADLV